MFSISLASAFVLVSNLFRSSTSPTTVTFDNKLSETIACRKPLTIYHPPLSSPSPSFNDHSFRLNKHTRQETIFTLVRTQCVCLLSVLRFSTVSLRTQHPQVSLAQSLTYFILLYLFDYNLPLYHDFFQCSSVLHSYSCRLDRQSDHICLIYAIIIYLSLDLFCF